MARFPRSLTGCRAFETLAFYGQLPGVEAMAHGAPMEQVLTDLLADLMHLAAEREPHMFDNAARLARMHFEAEGGRDRKTRTKAALQSAADQFAADMKLED